ncbi:hypothetical protein VQ03_24195 [Methylobacterium tarhaniae]|uniref:Macrocin-O-methyltransferase n=1 Tax=Methylobacterium tarhaniae TaxID=1187852 RepID=A0A0J6V4Y3_9HYPH|nr:hypothetical protein [Methylobacterium tarhaniae]KMO33951.1 hypothetical protein VQ03_24195 [Methylobacterium tarhaniae]
MSYPVGATPTVFVDHNGLGDLIRTIDGTDGKVVLVGFGEYAKHIINLRGDRVAAVYDPNPLYAGRGMHFRGVPVVDLPHRVEASKVLGCEYKHLYDYLGKVVRFYDWTSCYYPPQLSYKSTSEINPFEQEMLYHSVLKNEADAPVSMMGGDKIRFLIELLRTGLAIHPTASVIEMGSWQGGSSWFIAKTMKYLGQQRKFYMMDLFETHVMDPTATMCYDEIHLRMNEVYDHVELITGLVDDPACLAKVQAPLCFAHVDLGWQEPGLRYVWDNLVPGSPLLLDNYGHLAAPPWRFDDFFQDRGTRVTRLPWSEQGLVFKH